MASGRRREPSSRRGEATSGSRLAWAERTVPAENLLSELLVCPACRDDLEWQTHEIRCKGCGAAYDIVDRIPVLRPAESTAGQKDVQAAYFDEADPEFEVTRPHGTPWLYRWLLAEKFRRSLDGLPFPAEGLTAATVCAGS